MLGSGLTRAANERPEFCSSAPSSTLRSTPSCYEQHLGTFGRRTGRDSLVIKNTVLQGCLHLSPPGPLLHSLGQVGKWWGRHDSEQELLAQSGELAAPKPPNDASFTMWGSLAHLPLSPGSKTQFGYNREIPFPGQDLQAAKPISKFILKAWEGMGQLPLVPCDQRLPTKI